MPRDVPSEVDVVARTHFFAPSFRGGQVIADPTVRLRHLGAHISPRSGRPDAVGERIEHVLTRVTRRLSSLDPQAPRHERVIARLLSASLPPRAPLVARLQTPPRDGGMWVAGRAVLRPPYAVVEDSGGYRGTLGGRAETLFRQGKGYRRIGGWPGGRSPSRKGIPCGTPAPR